MEAWMIKYNEWRSFFEERLLEYFKSKICRLSYRRLKISTALNLSGGEMSKLQGEIIFDDLVIKAAFLLGTPPVRDLSFKSDKAEYREKIVTFEALGETVDFVYRCTALGGEE